MNLLLDIMWLMLRHLDQRVAHFTLHGLVVSTTRNLKTHINTYVSFCIKYNLAMFPANILQMRRYMVHLTETHKSVDSMKNYVCGVRTLHLLLGFTPPPHDDYLYKLTVRGIKRDKGHMVRQAMGMTPELLVACSRFVDSTDGRQLAAWVALLVGFYVMVRKSNLVPPSGVTFNPAQQFTRGNFIKTHYGYLAKIYWSKTIQFKDRCLDVPILANPDLRICPVFWLDMLFNAVPADVASPAFGYHYRDEYVALSYPQLSSCLKT